MHQCGKQLLLLTGLTLLAANLYVFKRAKCPFKLFPGKTYTIKRTVDLVHANVYMYSELPPSSISTFKHITRALRNMRKTAETKIIRQG